MNSEMNRNSAVQGGHLALERSAKARSTEGSLSVSAPLYNYRDVYGWVLLADPGAGKTDSFEALSDAEDGHYVRARDFLELDLPANWTPPIFIDGLDEVTAGASGSTALGQIRTKLQQLGTPKFRLSCREADWRGNADSAALQRLTGDRDFLELHLQPLNRAQTAALIAHWQQLGETAATEFIREAESRDLEGLLDNPQTLRMLVESVAATANGWPVSKTQTYEMACAKLVQEHSEDHLAANRYTALPHDQLLHAAGYLSAIMLLSGSSTVALQRSDHAQTGIVALPELPSSDLAPGLQICQAAIQTRLFRGNGAGEFWPAHRTVAEYLGARYLVSRIHEGLPYTRVLALMLGEDVGVVPELRGLHAWLAALATRDLRSLLIDNDPLGIVLNGDVHNFNRQEKLHVLEALREEATRYTYFRNQNWASKPFGALATADMVEDFKIWLQSTDRSPAHLALVDCLLDALAHGHHMPELVLELHRIVRDRTYWPGSRKEALKVLVAYAQRDNSWPALARLLADVQANVVEDLEDELLGTLLQALYPSRVGPRDVWQFFKKPKSDRLLGSYWHFWHELPKQASDEDVAVLIDALLATGYQLSNQHDRIGSADIVGQLLVRGVLKFGTAIEGHRLYSWLSLGLGPYHHSPLSEIHQQALRQWLGEHPTIFKVLFDHGLGQLGNADETAFSKLWRLRAQLYRTPAPVEAVDWYLTAAGAATSEDLRRQLLIDAFHIAQNLQGPDSAIQLLETWSARHPVDASWVESFFVCTYPLAETEQEHIDNETEYRRRTAAESREKISFFREKLRSFADGPAHLGALVEVANSYLNLFHGANEKDPEARLFKLLNEDKSWVQLALHGLRQCLFRSDLPSAAAIVDLNKKGQRYNLATPCLAAMELRYAEDSHSALDLPPPVLETVVAFRLTNSFGDSHAWFKQLVIEQPETLANVMGPLIGQQIASKKEHPDGLYDLAHNTDYAEVARRVVPALLAEFPAKASKKQLQSLRLLIASMVVSLDSKVQLELIASKLSVQRMDVAQHVYWLVAGLQVAPNLYQERAQQFVGKNQMRVSHLFAMIHEQSDRGSLRVGMPAATQAYLVGLLGPRCNPSWPNESFWVTPAMESGRLVEWLISSLAGNPADDAVQALAELQKQPDLGHWAGPISRAIYDQQTSRRKALFRPASVDQVSATLANLSPANAADLWALTVDHLKGLIHQIRNGNTDDYGQYWAGDLPKLEVDCRNALLSDLKPLLNRIGVAAEPEGIHADQTRADIKVIAPPYQIPIELKREMHPDLWKAISEQLVAKYGRETASEGYGIFIVFWFTGALKAAPRDGGSKPKTPQELEERLSLTVPQHLRHKIAVLVVDCSKKKQKTEFQRAG